MVVFDSETTRSLFSVQFDKQALQTKTANSMVELKEFKWWLLLLCFLCHEKTFRVCFVPVLNLCFTCVLFAVPGAAY